MTVHVMNCRLARQDKDQYQNSGVKDRYQDQGRVANPRPVAKIKTGLVSQPITDADDETGRDRSCIATRPSTA